MTGHGHLHIHDVGGRRGHRVGAHAALSRDRVPCPLQGPITSSHSVRPRLVLAVVRPRRAPAAPSSARGCGAVPAMDAGPRKYKPSTVSRRLSVVTGFYRTCVIDGVLEQSPAEYVRRPRVPAESPTLGLSHLQFEALLTAARDSANAYDFALVSMLGLLGLRIFEATGADIEDLGEVHGHRVLRVHGKGDKVALVPLPPAVARAIDRAAADRTAGPILLSRAGTRMGRHVATRRLQRLAQRRSRHRPDAPAHAPAHLRHHHARRRRRPARRPDRRPPRRPADHHALRPRPARTSTATPTTSSPPTWRPAPNRTAADECASRCGAPLVALVPPSRDDAFPGRTCLLCSTWSSAW